MEIVPYYGLCDLRKAEYCLMYLHLVSAKFCENSTKNSGRFRNFSQDINFPHFDPPIMTS